MYYLSINKYYEKIKGFKGLESNERMEERVALDGILKGLVFGKTPE